MSDTETLPHIFSLSPEDRRAEYDAALDRVKEAGREAAAAHNARKPDPRSIHDYRAYHTMRMVCVLVVKHRDKPASIECSRDGSYYPHVYLPISKIIVQPESADGFVLALVPKWLAEKGELMGVALPLSPARPWTEKQIETWEALRKLRLGINSKIYFAKRRAPSNISRGNAA